MKKLFGIIYVIVLLLLASYSLIVFANIKGGDPTGAGSHGGDKIQSDFLKAQAQVLYILTNINDSSIYNVTQNEEIINWIKYNRQHLYQILSMMKLKWDVDPNQEHCAVVYSNSQYVVHLSRPKCTNISTIPQAGEILIHEAIHMMGVYEEELPSIIARIFYMAWEYEGHNLDKHLYNTHIKNSPSGRVFHTAVWSGTHMIVWGGETEKYETNTGALYNPVTDSWKEMTTQGAPAARKYHTAVWANGVMIIWGGGYFQGSNRAIKIYASGGIYNPLSDSWYPMTTRDAPQERVNHTAVWTGEEMIIWGGKKQIKKFLNFEDVYLGGGGIYNPTTNTWRPISTVNAPSPRALHTAIWTGDKYRKMIIWGGISPCPSCNRSLSTLNTGAIYDLDTNTWKAMSTINAPKPRAEHTAVWADGKMIIFGGYTINTYSVDELNDGAIYDLEKDMWTPINNENAPDPRKGHNAVWTGDKMIIFGGKSPIAMEPEQLISKNIKKFNTIAIYNPNSDTWSYPQFQDTWMDRIYSTAVWTGREMIVWGGEDYRQSGRVFIP